jgi:hypothetical protein
VSHPLTDSNQNQLPAGSTSRSSIQNQNQNQNQNEKEKVVKKSSGQLTAEDYYEIYRNLKAEGGLKKSQSKGVTRQSSFSSRASPKEIPKESNKVRRSSTFSVHPLKHRDFSPDELNKPEMLEQNNQRPPEIKVTGGIAER